MSHAAEPHATEKTAGPVGAGSGGETPTKGIEMNTTIKAQHTKIHESLQDLVAAAATDSDVRGTFPVPAQLPAGDPHWIDQDEVRVERPDTMGNDFYVVRVYDLKTGERMFDGDGERAPEGWYPEQLGEWYEHLNAWGRSFPNTYLVNGDYLFVSGGAWVITGIPTLDGRVEFTSWSSLKAEMAGDLAKQREEWFESHAEAVAAVEPAWADRKLTWIDMVDGDDDIDLIGFRRDVGSVAIEQCFNIDDGEYTAESDPQIRIIDGRDDNNVLSLDGALTVGPDVFKAVCLVQDEDHHGQATVSDLFRVAESFSVNPGDLMALDESGKTPTELIVSKIRRAADLLEQVAALEAEIAGGDEDAFADAIRPHLVRIGVALGDIPADVVSVASGLDR